MTMKFYERTDIGCESKTIDEWLAIPPDDVLALQYQDIYAEREKIAELARQHQEQCE